MLYNIDFSLRWHQEPPSNKKLAKSNFSMNDREHGLRTPNEGIKSKISEKFGRCGRQNMLRPYLNIWDLDSIFGCAVKAIHPVRK